VSHSGTFFAGTVCVAGLEKRRSTELIASLASRRNLL
jgi:hypothetical protein